MAELPPRGALPHLAAIINASPESFFAGSVYSARDAITRAAAEAEEDGAALLDIGARSTAPYKETAISEEEELRRMVEAVRAARAASRLPISADTRSAAVARAALDAGADAINDVSALLHDAGMGPLIAGAGCPAILMVNGDYVNWPEWQQSAEVIEPVAVTRRLLLEAISRAEEAGIDRRRVMVDPGIGFFRRAPGGGPPWDWKVLRGLGVYSGLGAPLLVGASRKSFLGSLSRDAGPEGRLAGSLAVALWCARHEVAWLRVHDVAETRDALAVLASLQQG